MTSPVSTQEGTKQKFVPKRRAPYLLQNEVINQSLSKQVGSITQISETLDNEASSKKPQDQPIKIVLSQETESEMVNKGAEM